MAATFLELKVGKFRLALRADHVMSVLSNVDAAPQTRVRGDSLAFVDLRPRFGGDPRAVVPFAVAVDAGAARLVLGVDGVDHLRADDLPAPVPMPAFGLTRPDLFEGALRDAQGVLLLLEPTALTSLIPGAPARSPRPRPYTSTQGRPRGAKPAK